MLKVYTVLSFIIISLFSSAQVEIILLKTPGQVYNGQILERNAHEANDTIKFKCVNVSGSSITMNFRRLVLSSSTSFTDSFCDNSLCVDLTGPDWSTQNGYAATISAGDTSNMKGAFEFSESGELLIRYYVLDGAYAPIDSVDVHYTSFLKIEEAFSGFSTYPNPAKDALNIDVESAKGNLQVKFYSTSGSFLRQTELSEGLNTIDVSEFQEGIYFYSIFRDGEAVETEKLIIH